MRLTVERLRSLVVEALEEETRKECEAAQRKGEYRYACYMISDKQKKNSSSNSKTVKTEPTTKTKSEAKPKEQSKEKTLMELISKEELIDIQKKELQDIVRDPRTHPKLRTALLNHVKELDDETLNALLSQAGAVERMIEMLWDD